MKLKLKLVKTPFLNTHPWPHNSNIEVCECKVDVLQAFTVRRE